MNIFQENGYEDKEEYIKLLADRYRVRLSLVQSLALLYTDEEYFTNLVTTVVSICDINALEQQHQNELLNKVTESE